MGVCPRYLRSRRPSYKIECLGWWFFSSTLPLRANRSKILVPVGVLSSTNYLWCCIQLLILLVSLIFSFVSHSNFFPFTTHDFNTRIYLSLNPFILRLILSSCTLVPLLFSPLLLLLPQACVRGWLLWVETSRAVVPALPAACGVGRAKYEGLPARPTEWPPAG